MSRRPRPGLYLLVAIACVVAVACQVQLRRPDTTPLRMIEPQLIEPAERATSALGSDAVPVRLLETQARGHIGRRVLHQQSNGELIDDPVWQWSSAPDRYLDTALRLELASSSNLRLVDAATAPTLAATLLVWHLESAGETRLVGAVEIRFTGTDRAVRTRVFEASEPVSAELPGNLGSAAGRLLRRLAAEGLTTMVRE